MHGEVFNSGPGARGELGCPIVVAEIDTSPDLNAIPEAAHCVPSVTGTQPLCTISHGPHKRAKPPPGSQDGGYAMNSGKRSPRRKAVLCGRTPDLVLSFFFLKSAHMAHCVRDLKSKQNKKKCSILRNRLGLVHPRHVLIIEHTIHYDSLTDRR